MNQVEFIRAQVNDYYKNNPIGASAGDAFASWWLSKTFSLSALDANSRASDGSAEQGFDAFHLETSSKSATLYLVRAVFSDSRNDIKKAITGFEGLIKELSPLFKGKEISLPDGENSVLHRLVKALQEEPKHLKQLKLNFTILNLNEERSEILWNAFASAKEKFDMRCRNLLGNHHVTLELLGPHAINPSLSGGHVPSEEQTLSFQGVELNTGNGIQYYVGIGKLADLVHLYEQYGDHLFAKNVRAFLYKAMEKGPARYMRETLKSICDKKVSKKERVPDYQFAIFHNGVTLYTLTANLKGEKVTIREPSILNGCQTVKNAYLFKHNHLGEDADEKSWENIPIPIRIIVSSDEELIRNVTVSNNRQNSIRASAFRSNDPIQLQLGEKFHEKGIFYERQEGAFENLKKSDAVKLEKNFPNSLEGPITMEELAQAIASVGNQPALSVATKITDLFEDTQYKRLFSSSKLSKIELLVFLRNLQKVIPLALRDIREESSKLEGMKATSFRFPAMRVLARYIYKEEPSLISLHGQFVIGRIPPNHPLRTELKRLMKHQSTGLQQHLYDIWYDEKTKLWKQATDKDCIDSVLRKLRLSDVDLF